MVRSNIELIIFKVFSTKISTSGQTHSLRHNPLFYSRKLRA